MYGRSGNSFITSELTAALRAQSRRWLVTGGAGFIGSHLVECLLSNNQQVVVLDNFATGFKSNLDAVVGDSKERLQLIEGDIRDTAAVAESMNGVDMVLHQAALGSVPRSMVDPLTSHAVNVTGTLNIFIEAAKHKFPRIVYASSSSVYGDSPTLPKIENELGSPLSPYAATKAINEVYAKTYSLGFGLSSVGLRYFNVFGPRQDPNGPYAAVIPKWIAEYKQGRAPTIHGDGLTSRDFCFITNVVEANLRAALFTKMPGYHLCNIACGQQIDLNKLAEVLRTEIGHVLGRELPAAEHGPFREGDVRHSLANVDLAQELFGYKPGIAVAEGLKLTVQSIFAA